ncbi:MAG: hypothetical protein J6Y37_13440 [Paludibacteraceae bacterium]|nr:hypothetical protein [Paludibacteraceae bacterium]
MIGRLLREILDESVSVADIDDALSNHKRVLINYHTDGADDATGARIIEVYAYGLTKAGNPVIRAFQPYGDTTTRVPSWKFFRIDRISAWKDTGQVFTRPASDLYKGLGEFNPNGDETMSTVYKVASFNKGGTKPTTVRGGTTQTNGKDTSSPELFRSPTERGIERLGQQTRNKIKLPDIKTNNGFRRYGDNSQKITSPMPKLDSKALSSPAANRANAGERITMSDLNDRLRNGWKPQMLDPSKMPTLDDDDDWG